MAKKPGASAIIIAAIVVGCLGAYFLTDYVRKQTQQDEKNWQPVVVAVMDIPARAQITREMVSLSPMRPDHVVDDASKDLNKVVGLFTLERVRAKEQIHTNDLVKSGQGPSLAYSVPRGKRAITIGVDEIKGVGSTIKPDDYVDILATYTDPISHQDTTQMILQYIPVLAVDKGNTESNSKQGATTSITLAVNPEDTELIAAADRAGVLRVVLRPVSDDRIVASDGINASQILRGKFFGTAVSTNNEPLATPIQIISPPPSRARTPVKILRGTTELSVPVE